MHVDTIILGAGAAGMMTAAYCGGRVLIVDHAKAPGEKIRISGGGRCNFTNMYCSAENFLGENPHFPKSALARYTQWDFIDLVDQHHIAWHEKTLGQLFCDISAKDIIAMLRDLMTKAGVELRLETAVDAVTRTEAGFEVALRSQDRPYSVTARHVVVATGGKSIPKMGATGIGYDIARHFGHRVTDTRPALVPFTFADKRFAPISGVAVAGRARAGKTSFDEALLFTHRGLSGPAALQVSSYWREGEPISLNLLPDGDIAQALRTARKRDGKKQITTELARHLPKRLVDHLEADASLSGRLGDLSDKRIDEIATNLTDWTLRPTGTEGYRTAEVTLGGVATDEISAQSMMSARCDGLYLIGECVDVTGWLGGFNFQWAWSSAMAAARDLQSRS